MTLHHQRTHQCDSRQCSVVPEMWGFSIGYGCLDVYRHDKRTGGEFITIDRADPRTFISEDRLLELHTDRYPWAQVEWEEFSSGGEKKARPVLLRIREPGRQVVYRLTLDAKRCGWVAEWPD